MNPKKSESFVSFKMTTGVRFANSVYGEMIWCLTWVSLMAILKTEKTPGTKLTCLMSVSFVFSDSAATEKYYSFRHLKPFEIKGRNFLERCKSLTSLAAICWLVTVVRRDLLDLKCGQEIISQ